MKGIFRPNKFIPRIIKLFYSNHNYSIKKNIKNDIKNTFVKDEKTAVKICVTRNCIFRKHFRR